MAAGNAVIGALRVVLGADTAALETGLKEAQSKLSSFAAGAGISMAAVAVAITGAAVALGMAIKSTIDSADKMGKAAQSAGMPVEEFSKLAYAASLADVDVASLEKSLGKLSKAMSATAGGAGGPAAEAFKALGISVQNVDGTLKSSGDVLSAVAEKFKGYEDSAAKTALAIAIFGKAGAAMIPLLNEGADGIARAKKEAEDFGIVIDTKTAKAAEAFNDNLKRMSAINQGIVLDITARMLPAFLQLSEMMLEAKKNSSLMSDVADGLVVALKGTVSVAITAALVFQRLGAELNALWQALKAPDWEAMKAAWTNFQAAGEMTKQKFSELGQTLDKFWQDTSAGMTKVGETAGPKMAAPIIEATNKVKDALTTFLQGTEKRTAALASEAQTIGLGAYAHERLKIILEAEAVAKNNNIAITESLRAKIEQTATAYATMAEKAQEGKRLFEESRTPAEQFAATMERLNGAYQRGAIDAEVYQRSVYRAQDQLVQANPIARGLGQSLETAFDRAMQSGAKLSDVLRSLAQDLVKMAANTAFKALLYGTPGGATGGLLGSLFAGLPKFASGGSFTVPGAGGIDSQLVALMATPGEQVSVSKGDGSAMGGALTVSISLDNELLRAVVQDESGRVVAKAAPQIVDAATQNAVRQVPNARRNNPNYFG